MVQKDRRPSKKVEELSLYKILTPQNLIQCQTMPSNSTIQPMSYLLVKWQSNCWHILNPGKRTGLRGCSLHKSHKSYATIHCGFLIDYEPVVAYPLRYNLSSFRYHIDKCFKIVDNISVKGF